MSALPTPPRDRRRMGERFRPAYHFTASKNMINDPNGLVYVDGEFHLFYQYSQHSAVHWGHAISHDLVHWGHLPVAIHPDVNGQIFSGTAVVDLHNDSGLGTSGMAPVVAFFTYSSHSEDAQSQAIAFSNDLGRSWTVYEGNPVLANPGVQHFRDPKVFRHGPSRSWVMLVAAGDHIEFYRSPNLLDWTFASSWGHVQGCHNGVWECPDLFALPLSGTQGGRWVVSVSVSSGAPAGGSGMQYFVGMFDGHQFVNDNSADTVLWLNWGKDFYAGITWENVPASDGRRLMIAWMDNWLYRAEIPTTPFNGQLTLVRELSLQPGVDGPRVATRPAAEIEQLRGARSEWGPTAVDSNLPMAPVRLGQTYEVNAVFDLDASTAEEFGFMVLLGDGEQTVVGCSRSQQVVYLDRTRGGLNPHPEFPGRHVAPLDMSAGTVVLRLFVDRSSVELFAGDTVAMSDLVLPSVGSDGFVPFATSGVAKLASLSVHLLSSIWADQVDTIERVVTGEWASTPVGVQGSASDDGLALVSASALSGDANWAIEIVGTRNGNPARMLGEAAAGIVLNFQDDPCEGTLVLLDCEQQTVSISALADPSRPLTTVACPLRPNIEYRIEVLAGPDHVRISVDGLEIGHVDRPPGRERVALYVRNAEAIFRSQP